MTATKTDTGAYIVQLRGYDRPRKIRFHTSASEEEVKSQFGLDRPAYTVKGEDEANDKAWAVYNRAEIKIMRQKVQHWLDTEGAQYGIYVGKFNFSRYAGCSCSCSPGFIGDRIVRVDGKIIGQVSI